MVRTGKLPRSLGKLYPHWRHTQHYMQVASNTVDEELDKVIRRLHKVGNLLHYRYVCMYVCIYVAEIYLVSKC